MFWDDDYCLCGNSILCPQREKCLRAVSKPGIHTYSLFYEEGKECDNFILKEEKKVNNNVK